MAYIEPNTEIRFLSDVPFDPDYENTMYFDSLEQQTQWMINKTKSVFPANTYQRVSKGVMRVGGSTMVHIATLYNCNYLMFKNTNFENKWFYAFVDNVEYVSNTVCEVSYHLDVMQTWHFDYTFNMCMIERQHTVTDIVGANTIPENLETGDYVVDNINTVSYTPGICLVTTFDAEGEYAPGALFGGRVANGNMFSGLHYYLWQADQNGVDSVNTALENITKAGKSDGVVAVFMMPFDFATSTSSTKNYTFDMRTENKLGDYVPRNLKLYTWPYTMMYVTNYQGGAVDYKYEYFDTPLKGEFSVWGNWSTEPGLMLWPKNYKGAQENFDEGLALTGFPMCAWTNDAFKAWVAQNAGTLSAASFGIGLSLMQGLFTANIPLAGSVGSNLPQLPGNVAKPTWYPGIDVDKMAGGIIGAAALLGQVRDHYIKPPQSGGSGNGNLLYQMGLMSYMYCNKHIREEYAEIIDSYFDMYGYAIHRPGYPNRNARPCYTYVKTQGCSINGEMPARDSTIIQTIYDKGIRFWRPSATFGNFNPFTNPNRPVQTVSTIEEVGINGETKNE